MVFTRGHRPDDHFSVEAEATRPDRLGLLEPGKEKERHSARLYYGWNAGLSIGLQLAYLFTIITPMS